MKRLAGPATSVRTSCCDLKQNEQYTVLAGFAGCWLSDFLALGRRGMAGPRCQGYPDCQDIPDKTAVVKTRQKRKESCDPAMPCAAAVVSLWRGPRRNPI